jgi:hypothetical protein
MGDSLFQQDTIESINEATQRYVLAANILGPKPQQIPSRGLVRPKTYHELKALSQDPMGNAIVDLEGQFPFNFSTPSADAGSAAGPGPCSESDARSIFVFPAMTSCSDIGIRWRIGCSKSGIA